MAFPALLSKSLDTVNAEDVLALIGWPESAQLEFKQEIPGRDGKADPWSEGREYGTYGRDKLFKEVVAFANTTGGTLILGIAETSSKPPLADVISPISRCHDLAERLRRLLILPFLGCKFVAFL
jgi:predicted HTH transcriptional regulator